jgi:hypothetical protein
MALQRDEENKMYGCMMLPSDLHRVHAPEDDPSAHLGRRSWRTSWRRVLHPFRRADRARS